MIARLEEAQRAADERLSDAQRHLLAGLSSGAVKG